MAYIKPLSIYKKGSGSYDADNKWTPGAHGAQVWSGFVDYQPMSIREKVTRFGDPSNVRAGSAFFEDVDDPTQDELINNDMVAELDGQEASIVEVDDLASRLVLKLL